MTEKKKSTLKTVKNVTFAYTSVSRAQKQLNKENKPPLSDNPLEFHGWEVKILVSETVYKSLKKAFKGAKNFPNTKEYTPEECVEKNLMQEEPDEDQVLIKFTQGCLYGPKGNRKDSRPVSQIGVKGGVQDRNGLTINKDTNIGNGTKGHLQFNPVTNDFGTYLYPTAICITELVEYIPESAGYDAEGFGMEELDEEDAFASDEPEEEEEEDDGFSDPCF
jgi:hypothetical protein